MLGHTLLLIFILLTILIVFSTPDLVHTSGEVSITPQDKEYVDIVDTYVVNLYNIKQQCRMIQDHVNRPHNGVVLGSSTGHFVHELNSKGMYTSGVDESKYMVRRAQETFSDTFIHGEYASMMLFQEHSLSHVMCLDHTFCFIRDKPSVFRSVHHWLEPGGLFFIHVPTVCNFPSTSKYTSTVVHNTLREKAILDKPYHVKRTVYLESKESVIQMAFKYDFDLIEELNDHVLIFKSVEPVYL
jgi:SAM-dependent methyltransferase